MKRAKIYTFEMGNMAGHEWRWTFTLERQPDTTFTLSAKQKLIKRDRGDEPFEIEPAEGLTDGAALYDALCEMVGHEFVNDDPTCLDNEQIAAEIAKIDQAIADQYLLAVQAIEEDEEDVILPGGLVVRNRRLSKTEEMELYRKLDAPPIQIFRSRREPIAPPAQDEGDE